MASVLFQQAVNATTSFFDPAAATGHMSQDLYAGVDFAALSLMEQWWARWYMWIGNPVLATGIMSFVMHELIYFGRCIPWVIVGQIRSFDKYKIQEAKMPTAAQQWECTKYVLYTHFTVELPQIWGFHPMAEWFGMSTHSVPFPSWQTMAWQIAMFFVFEDAWHYFAHRLLHVPVLYKKIHKLHHKYSAPFGLAAEYAHPLEILILGTGTVGGPLLWCIISGGNLHILTMYTWITLRLFQAVDAHSGYDFPWSLNKLIPFWSGADHHDYHHETFNSCFSTSFRWMDKIFGTEGNLKQKRKEQAKLRAGKKE